MKFLGGVFHIYSQNLNKTLRLISFSVYPQLVFTIRLALLYLTSSRCLVAANSERVSPIIHLMDCPLLSPCSRCFLTFSLENVFFVFIAISLFFEQYLSLRCLYRLPELLPIHGLYPELHTPNPPPTQLPNLLPVRRFSLLVIVSFHLIDLKLLLHLQDPVLPQTMIR